MGSDSWTVCANPKVHHSKSPQLALTALAFTQRLSALGGQARGLGVSTEAPELLVAWLLAAPGRADLTVLALSSFSPSVSAICSFFPRPL